MTMTPKKLATRLALKQLARKSGTRQASAPAPVPGCGVKLDRQQLYCVQNPTAALSGSSWLQEHDRPSNQPSRGREISGVRPSPLV